MGAEPQTISQALTTLSQDESLFRDAVAAFAADEVQPRVADMERQAKIDPDFIAKAFDLGLMGIEVPEEYGGAGGSLMMVTLAVEEISRVDASTAIVVDVQNTLVNYPITRYGNDAQKAQYLTRLTAGTVGAYALSEPGSGSDAFGLATRAVKRGDHWILTVARCGSPTVRKPGSSSSSPRSIPAAGYKGITAFIVERGFPGFTRR